MLEHQTLITRCPVQVNKHITLKTNFQSDQLTRNTHTPPMIIMMMRVCNLYYAGFVGLQSFKFPYRLALFVIIWTLSKYKYPIICWWLHAWVRELITSLCFRRIIFERGLATASNQTRCRTAPRSKCAVSGFGRGSDYRDGKMLSRVIISRSWSSSWLISFNMQFTSQHFRQIDRCPAAISKHLRVYGISSGNIPALNITDWYIIVPESQIHQGFIFMTN